jgi:hypothetical protein
MNALFKFFNKNCYAIVIEDDLELVSNFGIDTVKMREIEMQEKIKLK